MFEPQRISHGLCSNLRYQYKPKLPFVLCTEGRPRKDFSHLKHVVVFIHRTGTVPRMKDSLRGAGIVVETGRKVELAKFIIFLLSFICSS